MTNIAVITLDTLRKDVFDRFFDWIPGVNFENAWAPSHYTIPVHGAMFTGKYPSESGVHAKSEKLREDILVLPELLQREGYTTRAWCENLLMCQQGFDKGFSQFIPIGRAQITEERIFPWRKYISESNKPTWLAYSLAMLNCVFEDYETVRSFKFGWEAKTNSFNGTEEVINQAKKTNFGDREFLYINLMEAHSSHLDNEFEPFGDIEEHRNCWDNYVKTGEYLSERCEELYNTIKDDFEYIILCSDHGELFGEYGLCHHWHGLYSELTHVPLAIIAPNEDSTQRSDVVSLLDIHQTVLSVSEVEHPSRGRNLLSKIDSEPILTEYHGIRPSQIEYLQECGMSEETIQKYDTRQNGIITSEGSFGFETVNGWNIENNGNDKNEYLQRELRELVSTLEKNEEKSEEQRIPENIQSHLSDLGYI
ncbi:sulfatase-like hydrolase/transferase [Haloprofundus halobius]|uniref:sulfatase-like hydrolase/transferase n=1 Tax=Haloprofundus halobius TaxID=2876194 RepID=UPI001CCE7F35|nr:sulfatase-like hydrolase/transferase [Haloprofundus halobius]